MVVLHDSCVDICCTVRCGANKGIKDRPQLHCESSVIGRKKTGLLLHISDILDISK